MKVLVSVCVQEVFLASDLFVVYEMGTQVFIIYNL